MLRGLIVLLFLSIAASGPSAASELTLAVASNFAGPMKVLEQRYERLSGHRLRVAYGSSGKMYAQIINGAPFDVFLSADQDKPRRLLESGHAAAGSRQTYARGSLVLWSANPDDLLEGPERLRSGDFRKLAIANPRLAPYGRAAQQVLERLGIEGELGSRLVVGENIAQAFQFVYSGNAELGFVAASQVLTQDGAQGSGWPVPDKLHDPILQDLVVLKRAANNSVAAGWLEFLASEEAIRVLSEHGYRAPSGESL